MPTRVRFGGSFAPPIDDDTLDRYEELAESCPDRKAGEAMASLCTMLRTFRETPESKEAGKPHPSGRGTIVPLESTEVERIDPVVPWPEELDVYGTWFDKFDPVADKELRDAAFHLLWFGRELTQDREPMTADKL